MKKTLFVSALAFSLVTPAIVQTMEVKASTVFNDISSSHPHKEKIDTLVKQGVIAGFEDGTFRPGTKVNRGQFALFISRALSLPMPQNPKSFKDVGAKSSSYDGVVKAQAAGIISGYPDGRFKADGLITRGDMAIMLDRALQYKKSFSTKATLTYSDKGSIGSKSYEAVQRLTHYKIMSAFTGTTFSANSEGDRLSTVLSIYQLMDTKDLLTDGEVITPPVTTPPVTPPVTPPPATSEIDVIKAKNPLDLTYTEVVKAYGPYSLDIRMDQFGRVNGFSKWDIWETYMDYLQDAKEYKYTDVKRPDVYLAEFKKDNLLNVMGEVEINYPNYEVISVNGKPFFTSELMTGTNLTTYNHFKDSNGDLLPAPPSAKGQFKIDLHYNKNDFATYQVDSVGLGKQTVLPFVKGSNVLMVSMEDVFKQTGLVTTTSTSISYNGTKIDFVLGSSTIKVNGQTQSLPVTVETKDGKTMIPIREVSTVLGLHTRIATYLVEKIEISNYAQPTSFVFR